MTSGTPKRIIRIFISSTFRNFETERDILANEVFEPLRAYCEANGFSFHPIDLRWGISYEDSMRNTAVRICLEEIRRSRELSPNINFMIMAGDTYGWQPLPETIDSSLWNRITRGQDASGREMKILHRYYRQDMNDLSRPWCLMPRSYVSQFADSGNITDEAVRKILDHFLDESVKSGDSSAAWRTALSAAKWRLNASATEQEITEGYFNGENVSKFNTFILLKYENKDLYGHNESLNPAGILREHLRRSVNDSEKLRIYEKKSEEDTGWIRAARSFLTEAVDRQIEHYNEQDRWSLDQENLENAYDYVNANYVSLHSTDALDRLLGGSRGQPVLISGASGSGKSWFLRHYAFLMEKSCTVAAVFNDVEPGGRNFVSALEIIVNSLYRSGVLGGAMTVPDMDNPAGWFEKQLHNIIPGRKTVIILDSINSRNMPGYMNTRGKSIFAITLPSDVSMIISAVSEEDLREADKHRKPSSLQLGAMAPGQAGGMLQNILKKHGRRLSDTQFQAARECIAASVELRNALSMEIMAQICGRLHSWENLPFSGRVSFSHLTGLALFHQGRDDYILLRSHALGYLALSEAGLTEPEITDLLSQDVAVGREIEIQTRKNNAHSHWKSGDKIPTVLWAVLYADVKPFLTEINDEGIPLLGLRHLRLADEVLTRLGREEQKNLLLYMQEYYKSKGWLLYSGSVIRPNIRKVQEYFPICEKLQDTDKISDCLCDPVCTDAFVRAGRQSAIRAYLSKYGEHALSSQMLTALQEKELLFRLWPDAFIPACISNLRMSSAAYTDMSRKQDLLTAEGNPYYITGNEHHGKGIFFPELFGKSFFALNRDGIVAALSDGVIRLIDMRKREMSDTKCASVTEECFLYWEGDILTVRCKERRLRYEYHNGQLNLKSIKKSVPDWGDLLVWNDKDIRKMDRAGGWTEAEHFGFGMAGEEITGTVLYHIKDCVMTRRVYEQNYDSVDIRVSETIAAMVFDHRRLVVSDLKAGTKLYEEKISGITNLEWSENGRELLIVTGGNTLRMIPVNPQKALGPMARPQDSYLHHKMAAGEKFAADYVKTMQMAYAYKADAYTAESGPSSNIPLFGALSVKYGWAACYLYEETGPVIRVRYDKEHGGGSSRIENINEITYEDLNSNPFYAMQGQNGLVLISRGRGVLFDMNSEKSTKVPESALRRVPDDETAGRIRRNYSQFISGELHLKTGEWPGKFKGAKRLILGRSKHREEQIKHFRELAPYYRLLGSKIIKSGNVYWLIDRDNGMFHAFDGSGTSLCRDMVPGRILDADIDTQDGSLCLFLDTRKIIRVALRR